MKLTVFAKERKTNEGKAFTAYFTKLTNTNTGEIITASVKFRNPCNPPKKEDCPIIILVDKKDANLSKRSAFNEASQTEVEYYTLWVTEWRPSDEIFEDHSLDDFE